jgi:N-methylhydantoinase A/oxoprolinase/acetone carboxylase beta subunit
MRINGPSIILNSTSTILIEPEWVACVDDYGNIEINYTG